MSKSGNKIIYGVVGVALTLLAVLLVNYVSSKLYVRVDCTEEKLYTLSENSKRILAKLKNPVTIRFYFSKNNNRMPVFFKNYAREVEDLLQEYKQAGKGKVIIRKFDPEPDSDAEDSAILDGVKGQMLNTGEKIYLGLAINSLDKTVAIPFLSSAREDFLEYDITNAITQVEQREKPVVGVMSALPVMGEPFNPRMMQMGQMDRSQPWVAFQELKKNYDVRKIPLDAESIEDDVDLLIVVHPSGISEKTEFAIDQFVLRGGKMIALLDPFSFFSGALAQQKPEFRAKQSSSLDALLKAWGIKFDVKEVAADMEFGRRVRTAQQSLTYTTVLDITKKGFDADDVATGQLNKVTMVFAGAFTGEPVEGLTETPLITTTDNSDLLGTTVANQPEMGFREFSQDEERYDLAIRLTGSFKTAFPDGPPEEKKDGKDGKKDADKKSDDQKKADEKKWLKSSSQDGVVVLIGDSDLIVDDVCVQVGSILGQKITVLRNDNLTFIQNLVDYLGGDSDLIGIRSRQTISRPFEEVKKRQANAEQKFKEKILELEKDLKATEAKLNAMQRGKSKDQQFILSPEQKSELKKFKEKRAEVKKDLKKYRKELRQDIDHLETLLKWINIALMPAVVILFGIGVAIFRMKRSAAK